MDRLDLVMGTPGSESAMDAFHVVPDYEIVNDNGGDYEIVNDNGGQTDDEQGASASVDEETGRHKHTLNRRQRRTLVQGVQKALQTHSKIFDVLDAKSAQVKRLDLVGSLCGLRPFFSTGDAPSQCLLGCVASTRHHVWAGSFEGG